MKIYIASDHRGYHLKNELVAWLKREGHEVADMGATELTEGDDYPEYGVAVARAVAEKPGERHGIVICGSGVGMAVVADKVKGIRAALIHDPALAAAARKDDDINVLALGADFVTLETAKEVIQTWLSTPFSGEERHERRINKITQYEREHADPSSLA